ncbi:hypothetical protein GE21DRAFT_1199771 [Neurospora crassa]|nr:hypothetical protein 13E11.110 [imported] - Neurospora crassa [Neurospora crassa]KHE88240.1 hypothetical protein GE21DRAFT_1199771 [Neurospora crassa]
MRTTGSLCTSLGLSLGGRGELRSLIWFSFHCHQEHEPFQFRILSLSSSSGVTVTHGISWRPGRTLRNRSTVYELVFHHRSCSPYSWAAGVVDGMMTVMVVVVVGAYLNHNSYIEPWWMLSSSSKQKHSTESSHMQEDSESLSSSHGQHQRLSCARSGSPSPKILLRRMSFPIQADIGEVSSISRWHSRKGKLRPVVTQS